MTGSLLASGAAELGTLWKDYWASCWHHPVTWPTHRLSCFINAEHARNDVNSRGDPLVSDYPRGRQPFLGVLTNGTNGEPSPFSGVLEYNDDGHLLTIAPTRAGKGAAQIVPNLLLYAGSCLVIDIKGENYDITHEHRRSFFEGARVFRFAPLSDDGDRYNPLDFVRVAEDGRATANTFDDARLLAEMLIGSSTQDTFWEIEARGLLTMLLLYVATRFRPGHMQRSLRTVVSYLFPPAAQEDRAPFKKTIKEVLDQADLNDDQILRSLVAQFEEHEDKVRGGILSTCRSAMSIWLSPRLQRATDKSDFRFSDLKKSMCRPEGDNPAPTTLYICIPPEYLREYRPVLRMMVGLAATELIRPHSWATEENLAGGWTPKPPCPVLFLLDEFPALGYMGPIEQGVAYLAGYGVQIWTFAQSIGQLREIYKENWTTFVSNAGAACYFGMADSELCEFLSRQLGKTGEYPFRYFTASEGSSVSSSTGGGSSYSSGTSYGTLGSGSSSTTHGDSTSQSFSESTSRTINEQIRFKDDPVATASDLRAMPAGAQIVLLRNKLPALATLLSFYRCDLFRSLYDAWSPK